MNRHILAFSIVLMLTSSTLAQTQPLAPRTHLWHVDCMDTESLYNTLSGKHGESLIMRGEGVKDDHFELWADNKGNFTLVLSPFEGMSCVSFYGGALRLIRPLGQGL